MTLACKIHFYLKLGGVRFDGCQKTLKIKNLKKKELKVYFTNCYNI